MYKSRYRRILRFFLRLIANEVWWTVLLPKVGLRALGRRTHSKRMRKMAAKYRSLAVSMGGVLIKVGQFLSSRLDVLPREITSELSGLQDEVGAEPFADIRAVVEAEFGMPLEEKFGDFDPHPIAAASIGQAHGAHLYHLTTGGEPSPPVVVKVQRPHIQEIVDADLAAINVVGRWLSRMKFIRKRMNISMLIEEFSRTLYEELDFLHEGRNAELFAENFKNRSEVVVPRVVWSHTTRRVITLQDVGAIKIGDYEAIEAAGISRPEVADRLINTYLQQIFEDSYFHADPHPGNLFVLPAPGTDGHSSFKLVFIDFGMTGALAPETFAALREVLISVGTRNAGRLAEAFDRLGILLPEANLELIAKASQKVFDSVWGKSTKEMMALESNDFRKIADEFNDLLYDMPFQLPANLILLGRCLGILSGMASGLNPDFNIWHSLAPYVEKLVQAEGEGTVQLVMKELGNTARVLLNLPARIDSLALQMSEGKMAVRVWELEQHVSRFDRIVRKLAASIVFAAILLASTAFYLTGHVEFAIAGAAVDSVLLLWIWLGR